MDPTSADFFLCETFHMTSLSALDFHCWGVTKIHAGMVAHRDFGRCHVAIVIGVTSFHRSGR